MHQIKVASVVGSPLENSWSQLVFSPNYQLICALGIKGNNAKNIGFDLAQLLENQKDLSATTVHNFVLDLLKKARELDVSPSLALIGFPQIKQGDAQPKTTLATYQGQILLKRHNKIGTILHSNKEINIIEGSLTQDDEFILGTSQTEQLEQSIKQLFRAELSPDAIASNLTQKVRMLVDSSLFASCIIKIEAIDQPQVLPKKEKQNLVDVQTRPLSSAITDSTDADVTNTDRTKINETKKKLVEKTNNESLPVNKKVENQLDDNLNKTNTPDKFNKIEKPVETTGPRDNESSIRNEELFSKLNEEKVTEERKEIKIKISLKPIQKFVKQEAEKLKTIFIKTGRTVKRQFSQVKEKVSRTSEQKEFDSNSYDSKHHSSSTSTNNLLASSSSIKLKQTPSKATRFSKIIAQWPKLKNKFNVANLIKSFSKPQEIYLGKTNSLKKRKVAVILTVVLLIAFTFNFVSASISNQKKQIQQELIPAQELLDQARSLENEDMLQARDFAAQAIEIALATQKDLGNPRLTRREFEEFILSAQEYYNEIDGQVELSTLDIFLDLREVFPNFITSATASNDEFLFFIDKQQNQLIALSAATGESHRISLEEELGIADFTAAPDDLFILNSGIYVLSLEGINDLEELSWNENPSLIKEEGDSDRESIFIDFYEGFLYVFNPLRRNIFRYIVRENELSDPIGWVTSSQGIEFASITSMTVDGQIWLTSNNGEIFRLERGTPLEFEIRGLDDPLGSSINIYTTQNSENLYILESAKNRLIILSKSGEFVRQIVSPSLAATTHVEVNEEVGKAFVVSGSIVYQIQL